MRRISLTILALLASAPALADEQQTPPDAYSQVMNAQYTAKQAPLPASAAEVQRIYDAYLRSIGKPVEMPNQNSGANAGSPSH